MLIAVMATSTGTVAIAQQGERAAGTTSQTPAINTQTGQPTWLVTVEHEVNIQELQRTLAQQGVKMSVEDQKPFKNIMTGVVIDRRGYVLTRLVNINPEAGQKGIGTIRVVLASGEIRPARYMGVDGPTGFCLLAVDGLSVEPAPLSQKSNISPGTIVTIIDAQSPEKSFRVSSQFSQQRPLKRDTIEKQGKVVSLPNLPVPRYQSIFTISFETGPSSLSNTGVVMDESRTVIGIPAAAGKNVVQAYNANEARRAAERIIAQGGNVPRGWLGVGGISLAALDAEKLKALSLAGSTGVLINTVYPNTPAAVAGLRIEDVVLTLNGEKVESVEQLTSFISMQPAGQSIEFGIWRDKQLQKINVTLGKRGYALFYAPDEVLEKAHQQFLEQELNTTFDMLNATQKAYNELKAKDDKSGTLDKLRLQLERLLARKDQLLLKLRLHGRKYLVYRAADKGWLGIETADLEAPDPNDFSAESYRQGVRVVEVLKASVAERAGVKPNDIITRLSGNPISSRRVLLNVLSGLQNARLDSCEMLVRRKNGEKEDVLSLRLIFTEQDKAKEKDKEIGIPTED
jgi:S1-C subfamily serine protease